MHASSPQSVHALLGYFLRDRDSTTPFPGRDKLTQEGLFDWGIAPPLEKVIESPDHLRLLLQLPEIFRQSVSIIEPWRDVGINPRGEPVRASKNVAYVLQQVADADTILYPVWRSGIAEPERLANVLSAGLATVVQGGNPSVHDTSSFDGGKASLEDLLAGRPSSSASVTSWPRHRTSGSSSGPCTRYRRSSACQWTRLAAHSSRCSNCAEESSPWASPCRS